MPMLCDSMLDGHVLAVQGTNIVWLLLSLTLKPSNTVLTEAKT